MSDDDDDDDDDLTIAMQRIAEEARERTGSLDLSGLKELSALPDGISGLTDLRTLKCSKTKISDLSPLARLVALQEVDCSQTQLRDLAPLANLTDLWSFQCSFTNVDDLVPLAKLKKLRQVFLSGTHITDLSPLAGLKALGTMFCGMTQVRELSPLATLTNLRFLDCSSTEITDLAPLAGATGLHLLNCSLTKIRDLFPLAGLPDLASLYFSDTKVDDLSPLAGLTSLGHLICSSSPISDLSPLADVPSLVYLNCSNCRLNGLPTQVLNKSSLTTLIAENTYIPGLPHGLLSQKYDDNCLERVRAHFADLAVETTDLPDVKLLLLGNGGVGKTQITRWLTGEPFSPNWDSTHGIQIARQPKPDSIAAKLRLRMWDFGGQEIYHSTHALFLRAPAIVMTVWAADRENREEYEKDGLVFRNQPLAYWVDVARLQANLESALLITQGKCEHADQESLSFPVAREHIAKLAHVREIRVSPKTKYGQEGLERALREAVDWMRETGRLGSPQIGGVRLRVQRRLEGLLDADLALAVEKRQHRVIGRSAFDAICAEEGGVESTELLLEYLDANGTVFYRPHLFDGRIVLDLSWALDAIYAVFDREQVYTVLRRDAGRFTRDRLGAMVWPDRSDAERRSLIEMMLFCGICFEHRRFEDDSEYIAPDLLPERETIAEELAARWDDDAQTPTAVFHHDLLHGGLIRSIMAKIGEAAGVNALYWRGGVCAYDTKQRSRVLIEQEYIGEWQGFIRIRTQDGDADRLLEQIIDLVERVQESLGLVPSKIERPPSRLATPVLPDASALANLSPSLPPPPSANLALGAEKSAHPESYVSYAWGDKTPEGRRREEVVDRLCERAAQQSRVILLDKNVMSQGDSISAFMERIGNADRIYVILSEKYLQSPFCMFELSEIWRTSRRKRSELLDRVRVYALDDAKIFTAVDRVKRAIHWKTQYEELDLLARDHGATILGEDGHRKLMQMQRFYLDVADILALFADQVLPRSVEELSLD